jgi:peptidoglycan/xylan/chitin deacetylase (PgdA/CDA1 family)
VIHNLWSEGYHGMATPSLARRVLKVGKQPYYRLRPLLPRRLQIAMRRRFARVQQRSAFPAWPAETALHDLFAFLFEIAGPVPWIAPWPDGREWAIVLTHDVETGVGYAHMDALCRIEEAAGYRSSFNLVPGRYRVDDTDVEALKARGFEVGAHSMRHDGLEFSSREALDTWLPEMKVHAERWDAVGFRSPSTNRVWELMPLTGFDYDSSYPDSDPFEPTPGGCCTWLPYFNEQQVELPVTLPQDHLVFVILERGDEALWVEKASFLRDRGGMALMIVHPDYMLEQERLDAYRRYLERYAGDDTAWRALPREVSAWWRRRAASRLELANGVWRVVGPAAGEARIRYGSDLEDERQAA